MTSPEQPERQLPAHAATFRPTPEQTGAITSALRPSLLVAGAGTGKTTVMAERILWLVEQGHVRPDQVLGLTFTNKAAGHLKAKVRAVLGPDADVKVATYHSMGAALVADHALELDLAPNSQVLNRAQAWQLLLTVFDEFRFEKRNAMQPGLILSAALDLASRCADFVVPIDVVADDCRRVMTDGRWKEMRDTASTRLELCQVVTAYRQRKRDLGYLDYGDQVELAVRLLEDHPDVAAAVRDRHPVALLDEYQDTNVAQRRMLQAVYPPGSPVTAVGDDMQAIYAFRGAYLGNLLSFADHFPVLDPQPEGTASAAGVSTTPATTKPPKPTLALQTTFRFGPALVELANRIQSKVKHHLDKTLVARPEAAPATTIECFLATDEAEEAATIAADIVAAKAAGGDWSDHAVLCRKRRLIRPIVAALEEAGAPVDVVGVGGLLDRPEIVDLVAWLQLIDDPGSSVALLRLLCGPNHRIGIRDLAALSRHARKGLEGNNLRKQGAHEQGSKLEQRASCFLPVPNSRSSESEPHAPAAQIGQALDHIDDVADLSGEARTRLVAFRAELTALRELGAAATVAELVEVIAARAGLWTASGPLGQENLLRFMEMAEAFRPVTEETGLRAFIEYLELLEESEEPLAEAYLSGTDAVRVMTIHQAKGLEFPTVHVPGLAGAKGATIFPDSRPSEKALSNPTVLPWWLRGTDDGIPDPATVGAEKEINQVLAERHRDEEWRLLYVACTRAQDRLVCSAAHWYAGPEKPQGPSEFYDFIAAQGDIVTERFRHEATDVSPQLAAKQRQLAMSVAAAGRPGAAGTGPTGDGGYTGTNPADGATTANAAEGAHGVSGASELDLSYASGQPAGDGHTAAAPVRRPPRSLSTSAVMVYDHCPLRFYWTVVRPLPRRPSAAARIGTEVHAWIQRRGAGQLPLFEPEPDSFDSHLDLSTLDLSTLERSTLDLSTPGLDPNPEPDAIEVDIDDRWAPVADDPADTPAPRAGAPGSAGAGLSAPGAEAGPVALLTRSFMAGPFATLTPTRVEAPFSLAVGKHVVRGRIDASYDRDGMVELVDFKTGRPPGPGVDPDTLQLDIYGLAALEIWGVDVDRLRTSYCWLRPGDEPVVASVDWSGGRAAEVRSRLVALLDGIAAQCFDPTTGPACRSCDFLTFCPQGQAHVGSHT